MRRALAVLLPLLLLLLPACAGTETGNPSIAPTGGVVGYEPMGIAPALELSGARLTIASIGLVPSGGQRCEDTAAEEALATPVSVDLQATMADPFDLEVPAGAYCEVRILLAPSPGVGEVTLRLEGLRRADDVSVVVVDETPLEVTLVTEGGAFELAEGESVLLAIDRSLIEASLGVATLELDPDGFAYVDDARNADRLAMLRDGMASAITLRRDGDGSGSLDTEELRAAPIGRAP